MMRSFQTMVVSFMFLALCVMPRAQGAGTHDAITVGGGRLSSSWGIDYFQSSGVENVAATLSAEATGPLWLGYNHRFGSPWALDASLLFSSMNMESTYSYDWPPYSYYSLPTLHGKVAVNSLSFCAQYHFGHYAHFDPYIGLGANLMMSRSKDDFQGRFVADVGSYHTSFAVAPTGRGSLGWTSQLGANFLVASHLAIKAEVEYIRNGVFMRQYEFLSSGHIQWWAPAGYKRADINPLVALVGLSLRW